jgi:hypothetical protein
VEVADHGVEIHPAGVEAVLHQVEEVAEEEVVEAEAVQLNRK